MSPRCLQLCLISVVVVLSGCKALVGTKDYEADKDGLVTNIGSEFYQRPKTLYLMDGNKRIDIQRLVLAEGKLNVVTGSQRGTPVELGSIDNGAEQCQGITLAVRQTGVKRVYSICVASKSVRLGVAERGDSLAAGIPYVLIYSNHRADRVARMRFSVGEESENLTLQGESSSVQGVASRSVTACDIIEEELAKAEAQCKSGILDACRDVSGLVANRVMEGCTLQESSRVSSSLDHSYSPSTDPTKSQQSSLSSSADDQSWQAEQDPQVDHVSRNMNPPVYPRAALRAGIQGEVGLIVDVRPDGRPSRVSVERSSGNGELDRAAVEAARKWAFLPSKSASGESIAGSVRVPVTFSLRSNESTLTDESQKSVLSSGFGSIRDAISELWAHPDYANLKAEDFERIEPSRGLAEIDASTQIFLPPGSKDTLVIYTENNAGVPFLRVDRFDGRQWRDVSAATLPGYTAGEGTNFYLDTANAKVIVRSTRTKQAWHYTNGQFAAER